MRPTLTCLFRLVAAAALVPLTACQVDLELGLEVAGNGGGRLAVALGADAEALRRAEDAGTDPLALVAAAGRELAADGWETTETSEDGGGRRIELSTEFDDPEELAQLSEQLVGALDAPEVRLLEPLRIGLTDDTVEVTGGAGLVPTDVVAEYGLTPEQAVERLSEALEYRVLVDLPADVLTSSATTTTEDGTLVWVVEPGTTVDVQAEGVRPGPPLALLVGAGAVGAGAGAVALLVRRRRGERQSA